MLIAVSLAAFSGAPAAAGGGLLGLFEDDPHYDPSSGPHGTDTATCHFSGSCSGLSGAVWSFHNDRANSTTGSAGITVWAFDGTTIGTSANWYWQCIDDTPPAPPATPLHIYGGYFTGAPGSDVGFNPFFPVSGTSQGSVNGGSSSTTGTFLGDWAVPAGVTGSFSIAWFDETSWTINDDCVPPCFSPPCISVTKIKGDTGSP